MFGFGQTLWTGLRKRTTNDADKASIQDKMDERTEVTTVTVPKASGLLADKLRDLILGGTFLQGDLLPSERDLVSESGLSRGSVREAIKILETEGLIEIALGRLGGARVTSPKRGSLVRAVGLYMRANSFDLKVLLDCRLAVEPMLARLCALSRTDADLVEIDALHAEFAQSTGDVKTYRRVNLDWHLAIARASRNDPLFALMEAIATPVLHADAYEAANTDHTRQDAVHLHGQIVEAIRAQDGDAASSLMFRHLDVYRGFVADRQGLPVSATPNTP